MIVGAVPAEWVEYKDGWTPVHASVIEEGLVTINVNGEELVTIMCTPKEQDWLALGFLWNEGLIEGMDQIDHLHISEDECCVDVWLRHEFKMPPNRIITSGCGGGVTFEDSSDRIPSVSHDLQLTPEQLFNAFRKLHTPDSLHATARGVHTSGLTDGEVILVIAEDVGRHNTIDKVMGICLREGIQTEGRVLLATGRISSEMLRKGARMGCPIVASRNSPTSMSISMADTSNISLVGYVRQGSMRVYTHPWRLGYNAAS